MTEPRISIDTAADCGCKSVHPHLDEFVMSGDLGVHFEAMGEAEFWISVTDHATGRHWAIHCGAANPNARGYATCEED